jgi:hypothetical protein
MPSLHGCSGTARLQDVGMKLLLHFTHFHHPWWSYAESAWMQWNGSPTGFSYVMNAVELILSKFHDNKIC